MRAVAANHPNAVSLDLTERFPAVASDPTGILYYDTIHQKEAGQAMFADVLTDLLSA